MSRLGILLSFIAACAVGGAGIGYSLNLLNTEVSREYFKIVLRWTGNSFPVETAAILMGVRDGLVGGFVFGLIVAVFAASTAWRSVRWTWLVRPLIAGLVAASATIILFGAGGFLWAAAAPELYISAFPIARSATNISAFGWVGGSIWGAFAAVAVAALAAAVVWARTAVGTVDDDAGFEILRIQQ